ncbi:Acetyltransferase (GNAT) family protein [Hathewaya proteolytica DSM 3090]|uniref:Acetyltransferase (GNAT) family protein n=1 Tax=Hathewaya proteolytica DSM 3090 TaxID=1121331 RepID=A0A1M6J3P4_9CLOT|nr:GNAT family N-acetyltransferase [Hathewaya proteolytica]SHJ41340.1 Acetyltransferase (GNAT) family protein [Hathewaya proteolytica DSM 3090]
MVDFEFLNNFNINYIECNSCKSKIFNPLNKDFISSYYGKRLIGRLSIRSKCLLLKHRDKIFGYIWVSSFKDKICFVQELYIQDDTPIGSIGAIGNIFSPYSLINYTSIRKPKTNLYLESLGFSKKRSVLKMSMNRAFLKYNMEKLPCESSVKYYKEGEDEEIRCKVQNEIFRTANRKELNVNDIYMDERQAYYINKGALFLKIGNEIVGYSQLISNEGFITIVNFGIIPQYREKGYGKILLKEIINLSIILFPTEKTIKIDVFENNYKAISLYKKFGFFEECIVDSWEMYTKI